MVNLSHVPTETLLKFNTGSNNLTFCQRFHCRACPFGNGKTHCIGKTRLDRISAVKNELNRREKENNEVKAEWKRLTETKLQSLGNWGDNYKDIFKDYDVEYMVLPIGEWTKVKVFDHRIQAQLNKVDPKTVYRFRPNDKAGDAWRAYTGRNYITNLSKQEIFKAGFNSGRKSIEA